MSTRHAFSKLNSKSKDKIRRRKTVKRKISPRRKPRPGSPLSNERDIKEFEVDTSPKTTPIRPQSLKDLAIEMANSKEKQQGCFGNFCKKVASKFTRRRRGGKRKRRKTRKRRKSRKRQRKRRKGRRGRASQPPRRR